MKPLQENPVRYILIVDDDPDTCTMLETLFRVRGYPTRAVFCGREAVKCMEVVEPDAVVLDVMMPEMDGWETFREMRLRSSVPVLFLTGLIPGECATQALMSGVNDYVRKPFHPGELVARIEALLSIPRSRPASELPDPTATATPTLIPT